MDAVRGVEVGVGEDIWCLFGLGLVALVLAGGRVRCAGSLDGAEVCALLRPSSGRERSESSLREMGEVGERWSSLSVSSSGLQ